MIKYFHVTFCDDIRHEINGKISFIGCYSQVLLVPSFPFRLPKICVAYHLLDTMPEGSTDIRFAFALENQILVESELQVNPPEPENGDEPQGFHIEGGMEAVCVDIAEPSVLSLSVFVAGQRVGRSELPIAQKQEESVEQ
jgi:hypothetical protein